MEPSSVAVHIPPSPTITAQSTATSSVRKLDFSHLAPVHVAAASSRALLERHQYLQDLAGGPNSWRQAVARANTPVTPFPRSRRRVEPVTTARPTEESSNGKWYCAACIIISAIIAGIIVFLPKTLQK